MTTNETAALEARATYLHAETQTAYERIPLALREKADRMQLRGFYDDIWPEPKPVEVEVFLVWLERWAEVRREIDASRPLNLKLCKVRRTP